MERHASQSYAIISVHGGIAQQRPVIMGAQTVRRSGSSCVHVRSFVAECESCSRISALQDGSVQSTATLGVALQEMKTHLPTSLNETIFV